MGKDNRYPGLSLSCFSVPVPEAYAMGGLTGVGTYPEYSNMGLMHKLLEQALKNMKEYSG